MQNDVLESDRYPDDRAARSAVARRVERPVEEVLLLNGAAEAFWLLAQTLQPRRPVCVHPSFTEAEAALIGRPASGATFRAAADAALAHAVGRGHNDFKIELARRTLCRTLAQAAQANEETQ